MSEQRVIDGQTWVRIDPPGQGYPIIMNGDHAAYEAEHVGAPLKERPHWPLPSFDARDWAEAFCNIAKEHGQEIDQEWMVTWFANALMRGYDECSAQSADDDGERLHLALEQIVQAAESGSEPWLVIPGHLIEDARKALEAALRASP